MFYPYALKLPALLPPWGRSRRLAYQLNERGRADRKTNQEIKRHLDAFTRGRIIGKLEEGCSVTSVAAEFGIAHSIVSRLWRQFQTTGTAIWGSVVVVHEEPHPQMTGTLSYRPKETGGQTSGEIARHTKHRRLDDRYRVLPWPEDCTGGGLFARRPVRCVPLTPCPSEKAFSVVPGTPELERQ
ncbi:transposable element Tcb2 transposase [Trichonephila clavipes]|uniref:Transposable element Tcb2 transposase n=1 Tax=Trichonephila clavipes TaxID=2585209 RepID=A0A8X6S317_TRICX|nr:transposable element Tcb2 transposase [Trichonephila clavipes]